MFGLGLLKLSKLYMHATFHGNMQLSFGQTGLQLYILDCVSSVQDIEMQSLIEGSKQLRDLFDSINLYPND